MRNSRDLVEPLRDRGVTLSESQIYRLVSQDPDRIAFQVLVSLCDIFGVEVNEMLTYTGTDVKTNRQPTAVGLGTDVPLLEAYRPVRARLATTASVPWSTYVIDKNPYLAHPRTAGLVE